MRVFWRPPFPSLVPVALLSLLVALTAAGQPLFRLKPSAHILDGVTGISPVVCADSDLDSLADCTFWRGINGQYVNLLQVREYRGGARYDLVRSDTCWLSPYPDTGICRGRFRPMDAGDGDGDGLTEFVGTTHRYTPESCNSVLCVYEQSVGGSAVHPDTLVWYYDFHEYTELYYALYCDLDRDGRTDILTSVLGYNWVFENRGDNRYDLVYRTPWRYFTDHGTAGDFDGDSAVEFTLTPYNRDFCFIFECVGDDTFALTESIPNPHLNVAGHDVFSGSDVDGDGRPEFFINFSAFDGSSMWRFYLYMYEATGDNTYAGVGVDSTAVGDRNDGIYASTCADIDLDGVEEVIWSYRTGFRVLKATGNNQFRRVAEWTKPTPPPYECFVTAYDMNGNGYPDIVASGNGQTWMLELEAVQVVTPNSRLELAPGDTCRIRWRVFSPPRCDSVSLFLRRDTTWRLDTIAAGLAPTESSYVWTVPPGPAESCRVVAIAYGPGRQFDESDTAFAILPGGIAGEVGAAPWRWQPPAILRGSVRVPWPQAGTALPALVLCDVLGRPAARLQAGDNDLGALGPGVYFLFSSAAPATVAKVIVAR
ncbi:MAG: VCBS repeat-containing protein [bacterium]